MYRLLLCNMLTGDLECAFVVLWEISPTLILYLLLFSTKKRKQKKQEQARVLNGLNTGDPKFIIIIIIITIIIIIIIMFVY
jgi:heme/copper-type cytochrome/quinol oxidase subunit 2